jgi:hypothetical protein
LLQRLLNLPGQRVRTVHTPFIRPAGAENAAGTSAGQQVMAASCKL